MKSIGEKIKEIRNNKELSQEYLVINSKHNQSLVSQIEKGDIKNPNEDTLRIFADNMGVPFDELVDGTDWDRNMTKVKKTEYAISQTDPIVTIEKSGKIKVKMKSYPRYNDAGDENKYCPTTGSPLVTECGKCHRTIESPEQSFCMGCGLFIIEIEPHYLRGHLHIKTESSYDLAVNKSEQKRIMNILRDRKVDDYIERASDGGKKWSHESLEYVTEMIYGPNTPDTGYASEDELIKGMMSTDYHIRGFFIRREYERNYLKELLGELKRCEISIIEKSGETDSIENDYDVIDSNEERDTESFQEEQ